MLSLPFLTVQDVAEILKVNEATIRGWIASGELRAIQVGRAWRVAQKDLEAFLNAHANQPARTPAGPGFGGSAGRHDHATNKKG